LIASAESAKQLRYRRSDDYIAWQTRLDIPFTYSRKIIILRLSGLEFSLLFIK